MSDKLITKTATIELKKVYFKVVYQEYKDKLGLTQYKIKFVLLGEIDIYKFLSTTVVMEILYKLYDLPKEGAWHL